MKQRKSIGLVLADLKDWIVSYLVVLIIPIVICSVFFLYTYFVIWEETSESNTVALQIVASELDDIFERTFTVEYAIQRDEDIQACVQMLLPLNGDKRMLLLHAGQALGEHIGSESTLLSTAYLIYPSNELVLMTGNTYTDLMDCYERIGEDCGYTFEEWSELTKQRNNRKFLANKKTGTISYIKSLPAYGSTVKMNIVLELNTTFVQKILAKLDNMENSGILLADADNQILMSRNIQDINIANISDEITQTESYNRISIEGKDMMMACFMLDNADLKLISLIPYKEFWSTALESLSFFWGVLALCILVGVGVSYVLSVRKHRTWGKLNAMAKSRVKKGGNHAISRSKEITQAVEGIVAEYDSMQNQLASMENMKKELHIISALKGRIRAEEVELVLKKNEVDFKLGNFAVILFKLNGFEHFLNVEERMAGEEDIRLIKQAIVSIVQELNQKEFPCEILNLDEKIVCIVDFENLDKEECCEQITQFATSIRALALERLSVLLTISISDVHKNVFSLQNAYGEALRVMEYQVNTGDDLVMNYQEMVNKMQAKAMISEQVKAYIQEHFADTNLSNSEIANHFDINITYLSTVFKKRTGMNLLTYIHMVRLEKAKELLTATDLNLEEIGEKVGYNNKVSFIRLFKKYEGITPTEYRMKERE